MTPEARSFIECEQVHAGLAVSDIAAALDFYTTKLGFKRAFTWGEPPTFAGVNLGHVQIFLQKGTPTPKPDTGAAYFLVGNADDLYAFHQANGVHIAQTIDDRPYGIREPDLSRAAKPIGRPRVQSQSLFFVPWCLRVV